MSKVNNSLDYNKNIEPLSEESLPDDISLSNYASDEDLPLDIYIKLEEVPKKTSEEIKIKSLEIKKAFMEAKKNIDNLKDSDASDDMDSLKKELEKLKFQNMKQEQPMDI